MNNNIVRIPAKNIQFGYTIIVDNTEWTVTGKLFSREHTFVYIKEKEEPFKFTHSEEVDCISEDHEY